MSKLFDEDYYHEEDVKKPVFSDSDDDLISKLLFYCRFATYQDARRVRLVDG